MLLRVYDKSSNSLCVSSNGIIALESCTNRFWNTNRFGNTNLPNRAVAWDALFPCWDDLYIEQGKTQGIFYSVQGTAPGRSTTFEFYTSAFRQPRSYYHFLVTWWENRPGTITIDYLNITSSGDSATAGIAGRTSKPPSCLGLRLWRREAHLFQVFATSSRGPPCSRSTNPTLWTDALSHSTQDQTGGPMVSHQVFLVSQHSVGQTADSRAGINSVPGAVYW